MLGRMEAAQEYMWEIWYLLRAWSGLSISTISQFYVTNEVGDCWPGTSRIDIYPTSSGNPPNDWRNMQSKEVTVAIFSSSIYSLHSSKRKARPLDCILHVNNAIPHILVLWDDKKFYQTLFFLPIQLAEYWGIQSADTITSVNTYIWFSGETVSIISTRCVVATLNFLFTIGGPFTSCFHFRYRDDKKRLSWFRWSAFPGLIGCLKMIHLNRSCMIFYITLSLMRGLPRKFTLVDDRCRCTLICVKRNSHKDKTWERKYNYKIWYVSKWNFTWGVAKLHFFKGIP